MDVGSNTVRGFVTSKSMGKAVSSGEVGSVIWAVVTRAEAGGVTLNPTSSKVWAAETTSPSLHTMIPGTKGKVTVDQKLDNGIKVSMKGGLAGYVHKDQLEEVGQDIEEVESGGDLEARLLYIVPTVNTIFLTLRNVKSAKKLVEGLKPGQVVDGATVENSTANSVLLNLSDEKFGLVNHRQLSEGKEVLTMVKSLLTRIGLDVSWSLLLAGSSLSTLHLTLSPGKYFNSGLLSITSLRNRLGMSAVNVGPRLTTSPALQNCFTVAVTFWPISSCSMCWIPLTRDF